MVRYGMLPGFARVRQRPGSLVSIIGVTTLADLDAADYHLTARGPGARLLISKSLDSVDLADAHRAGRARHGGPGMVRLPGPAGYRAGRRPGEARDLWLSSRTTARSFAGSWTWS